MQALLKRDSGIANYAIGIVWSECIVAISVGSFIAVIRGKGLCPQGASLPRLL